MSPSAFQHYPLLVDIDMASAALVEAQDAATAAINDIETRLSNLRGKTEHSTIVGGIELKFMKLPNNSKWGTCVRYTHGHTLPQEFVFLTQASTALRARALGHMHQYLTELCNTFKHHTGLISDALR